MSTCVSTRRPTDLQVVICKYSNYYTSYTVLREYNADGTLYPNTRNPEKNRLQLVTQMCVAIKDLPKPKRRSRTAAHFHLGNTAKTIRNVLHLGCCRRPHLGHTNTHRVFIRVVCEHVLAAQRCALCACHAVRRQLVAIADGQQEYGRPLFELVRTSKGSTGARAGHAHVYEALASDRRSRANQAGARQGFRIVHQPAFIVRHSHRLHWNGEFVLRQESRLAYDPNAYDAVLYERKNAQHVPFDG